MDRPIARPIRPAASPPEAPFADAHKHGQAKHTSASPNSKRRIRPGWKSTIVRSESFLRLRDIQKSTTDPVIDLSYLADACCQLALDIGPEVIVQRALLGMKPYRAKP